MNRTKGILSAVLAAFIYGFTPILGKLTYIEGSNSLSLTFYRSFLSLPILFALLKANHISFKVTKSEFTKLSVLGILGPSLTAIMLYDAYNYISVGMTTTIHYLYPVLVTLTCILVFKDIISKEKIIALILSTIGVFMFFEGGLSGSAFGILIALGSCIAYGSYILFMDKSGISGMYSFKITFYTCLFASVFFFIIGTATGSLVFKMSLAGWAYTLLVSLFVSVIANTLIPVAVKNAGSAVTSILGMFEPITSVILGILFLSEPFKLKNMLGCALIIIGVLIITVAKDNKNINTNNNEVEKMKDEFID